MMREDFQWDDDFRVTGLAGRFEKMLEEGTDVYFDLEDFELLIDYYQMTFHNEMSQKALSLAQRMHPYSSSVKIRFARQYANEGKYASALKVLNELNASEPDDVEVVMTRASVYSLMMEYQKAVDEYKKALTITDEEEWEEIYTTIAYEYENMGAFDLALQNLNLALKIAHQPEQLLFEIGMCYEMADRVEDAIVFFKDFLEHQPSSVASWFNLALAYHHLELYEKAIDAYEYVIAIDETYVPAYLSMAQSYAAMGEYRKALEVYHESETYDPAEPLTLYYMGECHEKLLEYDQALQFYHKALEMDDTLPEAWAGIGVIFDEQGNTKAAANYLEKAIELDQLNAEFLLIQAELMMKLQRYDKAKACFQRIEEIDPKDPDLWKEYAAMYVAEGDFQKAIQVLKTGLIHRAEDASIMYRMVAVLLLSNNIVQACYYLEIALEIDPEGHKELLEYFPGIQKYPRVIEIISNHLCKQ